MERLNDGYIVRNFTAQSNPSHESLQGTPELSLTFQPLEKQEADFYLSCQWSQVFICTNNAHVNYKQKNIQSIFFTHNVKHEIGQCEFCTILTQLGNNGMASFTGTRQDVIKCDTSYFSTYINLLTKMFCPNNNQLVPTKNAQLIAVFQQTKGQEVRERLKVKMLLLQRHPLCKLHKVEGQNTCDQIMSYRRFKHVQALNSMGFCP